MPNTFGHVISPKAPFCAYLLLRFWAFESFEYIAHVFLKDYFLIIPLYKLFSRVFSVSPVGLDSQIKGGYIRKRLKSLFSPFEAISGWAPSPPVSP